MTQSTAGSTMKARIRADLTASMKARDTLRTGTLRMVLAAIMAEEVAGPVAHELTEDQAITVLAREVKKRKESAEVFDGAGRSELADRERAESAVISGYLPAQLTDSELQVEVSAAIREVTAVVGAAPTVKQLGQVIKAAQARIGGRAAGARVAAAVKAALS